MDEVAKTLPWSPWLWTVVAVVRVSVTKAFCMVMANQGPGTPYSAMQICRSV
jgi:hypothetical protein